MGSSASKAHCKDATPPGGGGGSGRRGRSKRSGLFQSSCLGTTSGSRDGQNKENSCPETDGVKSDCYREEKEEMDCHVELDGWNEASISSTTGSSSARASSNHSRLLSRFSFNPGNLSFRLSRASSLGSSRASNDEQEVPVHSERSGSNDLDRIEAQQRSASLNNVSREFSGNLQHDRRIPCVDGTREAMNENTNSSRIHHTGLDNVETRFNDRRIGGREPVERNVRFSRTLSVGRLRDRVLRRSSVSDVTFCPLQQEREEREVSQSSLQHAISSGSRTPASGGNAVSTPTTSDYNLAGRSSPLFGVQDHEVETSRSREAGYHDLLEHRSNFLERRRRIRSQVRALQRLGSRFDNLSGHERSCILSGQHRMGRCTCRVNNRSTHSNEETGTRASISRIVMLAEALFEVLDEIHQQSVVLSSRPSVSAIGSVPAPIEVVESLPIQYYTKLKSHQNEESAQCYICLVEYEEGDSVRILPCHHEFHRACVDKWLKEIHRPTTVEVEVIKRRERPCSNTEPWDCTKWQRRVCPLCRGDICKSDSLHLEN